MFRRVLLPLSESSLNGGDFDEPGTGREVGIGGLGMGLFSVPCALFNLRRGRHRIPPADDLTESPAITGHIQYISLTPRHIDRTFVQ